ncbi:MAG: SCP2 sterol-binding domain-containing protein [Actinobacteria bacterium]|nr:SCP2 sterol-binding domain-containing protein [Actinomycetota bacterium]
MPAFLSDAWLRALDDAARSDERLADLASGPELVVQQEVVGGPGGDVTYHVRIAEGAVRFVAGPVAEADVRFRQDHATAVGIASGRSSAQRAFMAGALQVGGDLRMLVDRGDLLAALTDVFARVRAATTDLDQPPP